MLSNIIPKKFHNISERICNSNTSMNKTNSSRFDGAHYVTLQLI